ncbi:MAG: hypothetical protein M3Y55_13475 [Pseudomonadota bacterium]|nr:hypothetical protein [Pseudomonadota bacterium]
MKYLRTLVAASFAFIAATAWSAPPVPFYVANVTQVDKQGPGTVVIVTKDSLDAVCSWYRKNLADANGEHKTDDGAVIFYTKSGATVDVEPGNRFDPGTHIGLMWDAKKFGAYAGK